eukprot:1347962-Pyramimonas_sp.AAC.1
MEGGPLAKCGSPLSAAHHIRSEGFQQLPELRGALFKWGSRLSGLRGQFPSWACRRGSYWVKV